MFGIHYPRQMKGEDVKEAEALNHMLQIIKHRIKTTFSRNEQQSIIDYSNQEMKRDETTIQTGNPIQGNDGNEAPAPDVEMESKSNRGILALPKTM